jgi:hypothetical protein
LIWGHRAGSLGLTENNLRPRKTCLFTAGHGNGEHLGESSMSAAWRPACHTSLVGISDSSTKSMVGREQCRRHRPQSARFPFVGSSWRNLPLITGACSHAPPCCYLAVCLVPCSRSVSSPTIHLNQLVHTAQQSALCLVHSYTLALGFCQTRCYICGFAAHSGFCLGFLRGE